MRLDDLRTSLSVHGPTSTTRSSAANGIISVRRFVPAKDPATSLRFYGRLGFDSTNLGESLALLTVGDLGVLLQQFNVDTFAQNYMLQLTVVDLNAWRASTLKFTAT